jgi:hypothetical protein
LGEFRAAGLELGDLVLAGVRRLPGLPLAGELSPELGADELSLELGFELGVPR